MLDIISETYDYLVSNLEIFGFERNAKTIRWVIRLAFSLFISSAAYAEDFHINRSAAKKIVDATFKNALSEAEKMRTRVPNYYELDVLLEQLKGSYKEVSKMMDKAPRNLSQAEWKLLKETLWRFRYDVTKNIFGSAKYPQGITAEEKKVLSDVIKNGIAHIQNGFRLADNTLLSIASKSALGSALVAGRGKVTAVVKKGVRLLPKVASGSRILPAVLAIPGIGEAVGAAATAYTVCSSVDCKQIAKEQIARDADYVRHLHQGQVYYSNNKTGRGFLTPRPLGGAQ